MKKAKGAAIGVGKPNTLQPSTMDLFAQLHTAQ